MTHFRLKKMETYQFLVLVVLLNFSVCDEDISNTVEVVKSKDFETVEVNTKYGVLSGKVERTFLKNLNYYSFKGIPYAEQPVGKLRFKVNIF